MLIGHCRKRLGRVARDEKDPEDFGTKGRGGTFVPTLGS
jgi:hypothetical protein